MRTVKSPNLAFVSRWGAVAMARPEGLEHRLRFLLAADRQRGELRRTVSSVIVCSTAAACVALNVFRLRDASATEPASKTAAQVSPDYTRTLPGDVQVSLTELCAAMDVSEKAGSKQLPVYWKPDGTMLENPPFHDWRLTPDPDEKPLTLKAISDGALTLKSTGRNTRVAFIFTGLAVDQNATISRIGADKTSNESTRLGDGRVLWSCISDAPVSQGEGTFEIAVTSGPPTVDCRVSLANITPAGQADPDMNVLIAGRPQPNFGRIYKANSETMPNFGQVDLPGSRPPVSPDTFGTRSPGTFQVLFGTSGPSDAKNVERQIIVLDKNGSVIQAKSTASTRSHDYLYETVLLSPEDAGRAAFVVNQTRTRSLVTIDHVALKPKGSL